MPDLSRWRGVRALVTDAVGAGASAVERVHLGTARRPFAFLESIPAVSRPVRVVHRVHDGFVSGAYGAVRVVNRLVGATLDAGLGVFDTGPIDDAEVDAGGPFGDGRGPASGPGRPRGGRRAR